MARTIDTMEVRLAKQRIKVSLKLDMDTGRWEAEVVNKILRADTLNGIREKVCKEEQALAAVEEEYAEHYEIHSWSTSVSVTKVLLAVDPDTGRTYVRRPAKTKNGDEEVPYNPPTAVYEMNSKYGRDRWYLPLDATSKDLAKEAEKVMAKAGKLREQADNLCEHFGRDLMDKRVTLPTP